MRGLLSAWPTMFGSVCFRPRTSFVFSFGLGLERFRAVFCAGLCFRGMEASPCAPARILGEESDMQAQHLRSATAGVSLGTLSATLFTILRMYTVSASTIACPGLTDGRSHCGLHCNRREALRARDRQMAVVDYSLANLRKDGYSVACG